MNVLGHHFGLAATTFFFNSVIQGERSICLLYLVIMNAIRTPFRHLLDTMSVYKRNYNMGMRDDMRDYGGPYT